MITENSTSYEKCYKSNFTHLHWTAIFAGAIVGIGLAFLLDVFGIAIGLSAYSSTSHGAVIAIGGFLGILIGVIVAMGTAGFVAGYLSRFNHCCCHGGVLHGFITWSIALILSALLIMPLSRYVSFYEDSLYPAVASIEAPPSNAQPNVSAAGNQNVTTEVKNLAWSSWILFILFFVGALSSCIGACCGMGCKKDEINHPMHTIE
ncbi:hypothetical protein [Legionella sp.]|uniref:hypothetical protein n=1 Tax=Legionella sp. TaxID=459 RepID=UPI003CB215A7